MCITQQRITQEKNILLVEDSPILAVETEQILIEGGYCVIGPALNLESAFLLIDDTSLNAAVLDIDIAGKKVFPLARRLRDLSIPFLFFTAHPQNIVANTEFHQYHILSKPLSASQLLVDLDIILSQSHSRQV